MATAKHPYDALCDEFQERGRRMDEADDLILDVINRVARMRPHDLADECLDDLRAARKLLDR